MKKGFYIALGGIVLLIASVVSWKSARPPELKPYEIPMAAGEQVSNWNFKGAYTDNAELEAKAKEEIARLTGLLGSGKYPDYIIYVSIANQYGLLGDGKGELAYLEKALTLDSVNTGLAWHNVGQLFKRLGAYKTARYAFEQAVAVQPIEQYQNVLKDFLMAHPEIAGAQAQ